MKAAPFQHPLPLKTAASLLLAGLLTSGAAAAETPYAAWSGNSDDDVTTVDINDSFKKGSDNRLTQSWKKDIDKTTVSDHREDNDIDLDYTSQWRHSEDNDITRTVTKSQDNDTTTTTTEDNDVDVDFQIATPTIKTEKWQAQDVGHEGSSAAYGLARGHDTAVAGSTNQVSAGNDETYFMGPAMVNTNVNQVPVNHVMVGGSNSAPIGLSNVMAGRDMGDKGVFAPIGNTSVGVSGNVGQQSGSAVDQRGAADASIADPISSDISR